MSYLALKARSAFLSVSFFWALFFSFLVSAHKEERKKEGWARLRRAFFFTTVRPMSLYMRHNKDGQYK